MPLAANKLPFVPISVWTSHLAILVWASSVAFALSLYCAFESLMGPTKHVRTLHLNGRWSHAPPVLEHDSWVEAVLHLLAS